MSEKITNQSELTPWISRVLKTSVELILIALFLLNCVVMSFMFVAGLGPGFFDLSNVIPPFLVIGLALTIFLALQERVSRSSPLLKVSLGAILVLLAVINSYYLVSFINFFSMSSSIEIVLCILFSQYL
jgi:hypothetical protein